MRGRDVIPDDDDDRDDVDDLLYRRHSTPARIQRRIVAITLLVGLVGLAVWLGVRAIDGGGKAAPPPPPPPAAAPVLRVIFPEGFTRAQMAARLTAIRRIARTKRGVTPAITAKAYLSATSKAALPGTFAGDRKQRTLEGFLFPAAYDFRADETASALVRRQVDAFQEHWSTIGLEYARSKNLTPYDVLIIASMIEKEVVVPKERPLVAAVIYNRLKARMPLGIDATLRYGLDIPATRSITQSQLASRSPYNTRRFPGLPPTPIANPGLPAMRAAAHPARVAYLYFVRKPDKKHHFFTASAAEFNRYLDAHGYGTG